jgi:Zn-dependent protease with chaperone function
MDLGNATLLGILALTSVVSPTRSHAGALVPSEVVAIADSLRGRHVSFLAPLNHSATVYVDTPMGQATYVLKSTNAFRLRVPEPVDRISLEGTAFKLAGSFHTRRYGSLHVDIYSPNGVPLDRQSLVALLHDFLAGPDDSAALPIVANRVSRMAHVRNCNHLPDDASRENFASLPAAREAGYRPCPICFRSIPTLSDYALEMSLGAQVRGDLLKGTAQVADQVVVNRVQEAGRRVLAHWPVPLRGYTYAFGVLDSDALNAVACPGGCIYVTRALIEAIESDSELEAVLAHEITHIERRHGLQALKVQLSGQTATAIVTLLMGAAVNSTNRDNPQFGGEVMQLVNLVGDVATQIAVIGHSRANEEEADSYALAYLRTSGYADSTNALIKALQKLKYDETTGGLEGVGPTLLMSHPFVDDRIAKARHSMVRLFPPGMRFVGTDRNGTPLAVITLQTQAYFEYPVAPSAGSILAPTVAHETRIFGTVEGLDELRAGTTIKDLALVIGGRRLVMDNLEDTQVFPESTVGFSASMLNSPGVLPNEIDSISCVMPGVWKWQRAKEE